jgi:hypothetical protein
MPLPTRRAALATAAGLALALPLMADDKPKSKLEFRRAETVAAEGLTEAGRTHQKEACFSGVIDTTAEMMSSFWPQ